jgi:hypothetical protein
MLRFDRLRLRRSRLRPLRRGTGLARSTRSRFSSLTGRRPVPVQIPLGTKTKEWRPQGDLNPRRRRERAVSLAGLDDGDAMRCAGEPSRNRTCDPLIKSQMLYQLSYGLPGNTPC